MKYLILVAAVLVCAGCVSLTSFQSPQALPPGGTAVGGGLGLQVADIGYPLPEADFLFRYGLANGVDVGGKVALPFLSAVVDVKWQFLRGPLAAAFDVGGSYSRAVGLPDISNEANVFGVYPEFLVGSERIFGAARMLVAYTDELSTTHGEPVRAYTDWFPQVFVGGSFGDRFRVMPELSVTFGLSGSQKLQPVLGIGVALTYGSEDMSDDASTGEW